MKLLSRKLSLLVFVPACFSSSITSVAGQLLAQALMDGRVLPPQGLQNLVSLGRLSASGIFPAISLEGRPILQSLNSLANNLQEGAGMLRSVVTTEQATSTGQPILSTFIAGLVTGRLEARQLFNVLNPIEQSLVATLAPLVDLVKMVNTGLELVPNPFGLIDSLGVAQVDALKQAFPCSMLATVADQLEIGNPVGSQECVGSLTTAQYEGLRDLLSQAPLVQFITSLDQSGQPNQSESIDARSSEASDSVVRRGVLGFDPAIAPEFSSLVNSLVQKIVSAEGRPVIPSIQNIMAPLMSIPRDAGAIASGVLGLGVMKNEPTGDKKEENTVSGGPRASGQQYLFGNMPVIDAILDVAAQATGRRPF